MKWSLITRLAWLMAGLMLAGCNKTAPPPAPAPAPVPATNAPALPTHAQAPLQTLKLWLGAEEMVAELALTDEQVHTGMMFRTNLAENAGMLFVFAGPSQVGFWMKNCPLPMSAAYIGFDGTILEIRKLEPFNTNSVVAASDAVQYVIEANDGWFDRKHIRPGIVVSTERGTFPQVFQRRR